MDQKEYRYVLGGKPSHLGLVFNFDSFGDFRAWKSHEILTCGFLGTLFCQITTNQPKKKMFMSLGTKPRYFGLASNFGEFSCEKSWNFHRNIF